MNQPSRAVGIYAYMVGTGCFIGMLSILLSIDSIETEVFFRSTIMFPSYTSTQPTGPPAKAKASQSPYIKHETGST